MSELAPGPLGAFLAGELSAEITDLTQIKGGYSREMWSFAADGRPLIVCADSSSGVVGSGDQALSRPQEATLLHALSSAGQPVPDALTSGGATSALGRDFLVMERRAGTAVIGPLSRDDWYVQRRAELGAQLAQMLAGLHGTEVPEGLLGAAPAAGEVAPRALEQWTAEVGRTPTAQTETLARAIRWMGEHQPPPPPRVTLVHGDFRTGNILHGHGDPHERDGFRTVLDWEMAHLGDPLEDLAWAQLACWRVGTGRVGALVELPEWARLYAEAAGQGVDPVRLHWWEVLGSVKMSCLMKRAAAKTAAGEQGLLERLFDDLAAELEHRLLPPDEGGAR